MIKKIEEFSMNAFPALSTVLVNGWILRFSDGYARRANSVNLIYDCSIDVLKNIEICEDMYRRNALDTVFKLTEKEDNKEIDRILNEKGYEYVAKTNIMIKDIAKVNISQEEKQDVVIYRELRMDWLEAFTQMNDISPKNTLTLEKMLQRIIPNVYYGVIVENGEIVAVGMGVAEQGYVGMYDIFVHSDKRRKGLGIKIMNNLLYEASRDGCKYSYLQVMEENEGAKELYKKLGYEKQYSYWYRIKKFKNK